MDGSPNFFRNSIPDDEDGGYDFFDGQDVKDPDGDGQDTSFHADLDAPSINLSSSAQTRLPTPPLMDSLSARAPMKPADHIAISQLEPLHHDPVKAELPGLSSGSSETPESHSSRQTTEEDAPTHADNNAQDALGNHDVPLSGPPVAKKRRQRKAQAKPGVDSEIETTKRNRFLERNRVAATKCRQKKKEWVSDLEETRFGLESQNTQLQMEYSSLRNEISHIKSQLMEHASCNDPNIDKWIENEAKRFVLGASERYDQTLATMGVAPGMVTRQDSMSSASGFAAAPGSGLISPVTPSQRGSISFFPETMVGNSPVFYRSDLAPNMPDGTASVVMDEAYPTGPMGGHMHEDGAHFDAMHMAEGVFHDSAVTKG
ncbi:hypothetical protein GGS23DRAFT_595012 [Durotheca rogersii]|uniref:uncharacterized protein n=1 Tax=Durotheca rogersii TaxID=419775 RepID=UPI00222126CC|nr:uncharacterized protein GGS23DRAFT_595012 [Durotheca rogersii]KAI5865492.1 hypothetical protein GGS23DRAFT_595012 [Durotheca rogersii]